MWEPLRIHSGSGCSALLRGLWDPPSAVLPSVHLRHAEAGTKSPWFPCRKAAGEQLSICHCTQEGLRVPYLGPWVLWVPTDCAERLPATLVPAGEEQLTDEPGQDLMLSVGSRLSVEPMLEQASLRGEERSC